MIFNTFLIKTKKYKLLRLLGILIFFCFTACRSTNETEEKFFNQFSSTYGTKLDKNPLIMHSYLDINPYKETGFAWAPFVLPNENWMSIRPSDYLVGYWNGINNPILPPDPGICRILDDSEIINLPKGELKLIEFYSNSLAPHHDEKKLCFLLSSESKKPFAMIRMNSEGKASCFIALKKYVVSTGYGELRREFEVNGNESKVKVPFFDSSYVKVSAKETNGIQIGDLIRIGRSFSVNNVKKIEENFQEGGFLIPSKVRGDLYTVANIQSKRMNVDEYQKTTVLIGDKPFELQLEPALYTFAVLRKNKLICLKQVELTENEIFELSCSGEEKISIEVEQDSNSIIWDTTILPAQLTESNSFLSWLFANEKVYLPNFNFMNQDFEAKKELEQEVNKRFAIIAKHPDKSIVTFNSNYLINQYDSLTELNNFDINKIYLGVTGKMNNTNISYLRRDSQNLPFLGIPLGGIGEQNLAQNSVPFSAFTKLNRIILRPEFIKYANVQASNGVTFSIFEPLTTQNNEGMFSSYVQQKFRLRVAVPEWNATNIVEMYVNGKLRRRWILDRGDVSKPFSASFEENIMEFKAFTVRWVAWGDEYLPDFLVGTHNSQPFAITRDFCIDYIGDGICHVEKEK